jgi:hypothetical protein
MSGNQNPTPPSTPTTVIAAAVQSTSLSERLTLGKLVLIVGLLIQLGTGIWYAAMASAELSDHEKRIAKSEETRDARSYIGPELADHDRRIASLENSQALSNTQIQQALQGVSAQLAALTAEVADLKDLDRPTQIRGQQ